MAKSKRRPLTPSQSREWAEMAHLLFIDALSNTTPMQIDKVTFHGGTNLHISWGSPRYSEDLDFLVARDFGSLLVKQMPKIEKRMASVATLIDPNLKIEIRNKTKDPDGLLNYRIIVSSPEVMGQVMAKAEFWQVEPGYIEKVDRQFVQPRQTSGYMSRISQPIPVASMDAAFADKIVALSYRPYLKWRDIFDLWWLKGQTRIEPSERIENIMHHATAYEAPEGMSLKSGLEAFLARDPKEMMESSDPDLKRWLPKQLWETLYPHGVQDMIDNARMMAESVIENLPADDKDLQGDDDGTRFGL